MLERQKQRLDKLEQRLTQLQRETLQQQRDTILKVAGRLAEIVPGAPEINELRNLARQIQATLDQDAGGGPLIF